MMRVALGIDITVVEIRMFFSCHTGYAVTICSCDGNRDQRNSKLIIVRRLIRIYL